MHRSPSGWKERHGALEEEKLQEITAGKKEGRVKEERFYMCCLGSRPAFDSYLRRKKKTNTLSDLLTAFTCLKPSSPFPQRGEKKTKKTRDTYLYSVTQTENDKILTGKRKSLVQFL